MKHFRFFLLTSVIAGGAWAQPAVSRETAAGQNAPEQRRAELRSALRATRGGGGQDQSQTLEKAYLTRQLSPQEKADLRQQLQQQRREARLDPQ